MLVVVVVVIVLRRRLEGEQGKLVWRRGGLMLLYVLGGNAFCECCLDAFDIDGME